MVKAKKVSKIKIKKKRWFPIFAPSFIGKKEIGESYLNDAEAAVGRGLKINLKELTGSIKDQNIYVYLKINEVKGSNLQTEITGYAYMPFYIKRLSRRNTGKIDDSVVVKTKDGKTVRMKPLVIAVFSSNKSLKTTIRKQVRSMLIEEAGKLPWESLLTELFRYKLQAGFKKKLNKLCPIREVVMRVVKIDEGKKAKVLAVKKEDVEGGRSEEKEEVKKEVEAKVVK